MASGGNTGSKPVMAMKLFAPLSNSWLALDAALVDSQDRVVCEASGDKRWKLMLKAPGLGSLFDLRADPGESTNLRFDQPELFAGLGMLLTRRASLPPAVAPTIEESELTEEDRKMLEALGYVE